MTTKVLTVRRDVAVCPIRDCPWSGPLRETHWQAKRDARAHDNWHGALVVFVLLGLWWGCEYAVEQMALWPETPSGLVIVEPLQLDRVLRELGFLS
jgi:hypothetical protein